MCLMTVPCVYLNAAAATAYENLDELVEMIQWGDAVMKSFLDITLLHGCLIRTSE